MKQLQIPAVPTNQDPRTQAWMTAVRAAVLSFTIGTGRAITVDDLVKVGVVTVGAGGTLQPGASGNSSVPPKLTNLQAAGALDNIILSWDAPTFSNFGYAEVLRADTDDFGSAVMIGTTRSHIYVDAVGSGAIKYYWIRAVSSYGVHGDVNKASGTPGKTGKDPSYVMGLLLADRWAPNTDYDPFQYVLPTADNGFQYLCVTGGRSGATEPAWPAAADDLIVDGTVTWRCLAKTNKVPFVIGVVDGEPAVAMNAAFIQDATITAAKVQDAFIDNLVAAQGKFNFADINQGNVFDLTLGDRIRSDNYSPGVSGWSIDRDGYLEMNSGIFRGTLYSATMISPKIKGGRIILSDDVYYLSDADDGSYTKICDSTNLCRSWVEVSRNDYASGLAGAATSLALPYFDIVAYDCAGDFTKRQRWQKTPDTYAIDNFDCVAPSALATFYQCRPVGTFTIVGRAGSAEVFRASCSVPGISFPTEAVGAVVYGSVGRQTIVSKSQSVDVANVHATFGGHAVIKIETHDQFAVYTSHTPSWQYQNASAKVFADMRGLKYEGNDLLNIIVYFSLNTLYSPVSIGQPTSGFVVDVVGSYRCNNAMKTNNG